MSKEKTAGFAILRIRRDLLDINSLSAEEMEVAIVITKVLANASADQADEEARRLNLLLKTSEELYIVKFARIIAIT